MHELEIQTSRMKCLLGIVDNLLGCNDVMLHLWTYIRLHHFMHQYYAFLSMFSDM